jgi:nucleotide-binding universal stress UspA family protein
MILLHSILCPIDFSASSRGALRYAGAIAAHFGARLTLLAVNDPLLQEAAEFAGPAHLVEDTTRELERFFRETFAERPHGIPDVNIVVATGKSAPEILRASREQRCDLIVMSSHGATGFRKMFFGSTTERVLRETVIPMLVTAGSDPGPEKLEDVARLTRRVLAPVDLTAATSHQLSVAHGLAEALHVPVLLLHVVEPVRSFSTTQLRLSTVDAERRHRAERALEQAIEEMPAGVKAEALVAYGEPAEEIAKVATDRNAGIIVMGLHSSPILGPRMGSVTYRVLCLAHRLVLAIPPLPTSARTLESTVEQSRSRETVNAAGPGARVNEPAGP